MFGQSIIGSSSNVPQWILDLVDEVEGWHGFCTNNIFFKEAKSNYRGGCYRYSENILQFYFGREITTERVWVVLHELAHAFQWIERPDTLTKTPKGKRNIHHNEAFFKTAALLYKKHGAEYGVLEYAAEHEYKRGRKYMV